MRFPVFDLHCDTGLALLGSDLRQCGNLRANSHHVDLERAAKHPGYAQCFACFTTSFEKDMLHLHPAEVLEREIATIYRETEKNQDLIRIAYSPEEIEQNYEKGIMSAILTLEGTAGLSFDPELLDDMYRVGFRLVTLGWNEKNPLTGSHATGGGLTEQGRSFVKEAQRVGILVDVSHISDEAFWDIMAISKAPVVASHSNSRSVHPVSRNITDEMFLAICNTGGVVGINLYNAFLGKEPDLDTVCDHILHFLKLDPSGKHIALGGDLDGCDELPAGFSGIEDYDKLADQLLARGVSEETVLDIFWNNALGVMKKCST